MPMLQPLTTLGAGAGDLVGDLDGEFVGCAVGSGVLLGPGRKESKQVCCIANSS